MKRILLDVLRCTECGQRLTLKEYESWPDGEVASGVLQSECGAVFLVYQGVPKMRPGRGIPNDFAAKWGERLRVDAPQLAKLPAMEAEPDFSFSFQWSTHAYDDLTWEMYLPERVALFYDYLGLSALDAPRLTVLDAGCGNGTLTAELASEGFRVVGMDYSDSVYRALDYARQHKGDDGTLQRLEYVQGDVCHPPFADEQFDLIYSDGVLHHTPDTRAAFMALAPKVARGGRFFVWLYRADGGRRYRIKIRAVRLVQRLSRRWSYRAKWRLCLVGAAIILTVTRIARTLGSKRRRLIALRLKALNLFDTISPDYDFEHTPAEVAEWYAAAGFTDVKGVSTARYRLNEGGFAMIGRRR